MGRPSSQPRRGSSRLSIHLQDLFNRFRMTVRSFKQSLFDGARNVIESDLALKEGRYRDFVGCIERDGLGSSLCGSFIRKPQAGKLVQVRSREVQPPKIEDVELEVALDAIRIGE